MALRDHPTVAPTRLPGSGTSPRGHWERIAAAAERHDAASCL